MLIRDASLSEAELRTPPLSYPNKHIRPLPKLSRLHTGAYSVAQFTVAPAEKKGPESELVGDSKLLDRLNEEKYKLYMQQLEVTREERLKQQKAALLKALLEEHAKGEIMIPLLPQRVDTPKETFADKSKKIHDKVLKASANAYGIPPTEIIK